jgi:hypothetical protein
MLPRSIYVMALAATMGTLFLSGAAEAGSGWRLHFLHPYAYTYYPRPLDLYSSNYDYGDDEDYYDDPPPVAYDDQQDNYYEPEYKGQDNEPAYIVPKKKKTAKIVPVTKPLVSKSVALVEKTTAPSATAMTCDKAGKIVSGYGFTSVQPTSCNGQVFAFNATRSGKAYVIKLSSASGELTEVKKVQ